MAAFLALLGLLVACGDPGGGTPVKIEVLEATPGTIVAGEQSTINWRVTGDVVGIRLTSPEGEVARSLPSTGSVQVAPTETTLYTLVARNRSGGQVTRAVEVTVDEPSVEVQIESFTATPGTIPSGTSSTLAWAVSGDVESVTISVGGSVIAEDLDAVGNYVVSPVATTTYTVTATDAFDAEFTSTATVAVLPLAEVSGVTAEVTTNSQVVVSWTVANADQVDVVAVNATNPVDVAAIPGGAGLAGTTTTVTLPIPDSTHQVIRVVATNSVSSDSSDSAALANVVLNTDDYDPYDPEGDGGAEAPVPGTFRQVLANATSGSVIGFASDVLEAGTIQLRGVEVGAWGDAHFLINKDVTISAPIGGIVLEGVSGWEASDPGTSFSWRSRVLHITAGANAVLDNITITGGTFIFKGAGIRNLGTLTMNGGAVTNNRAWHTGGGIHNLGTLVLNGTEVSGNVAATVDGEVGAVLEIRGNPAYTTGVIQVGGWGGGIYNEGGTVTLNAATIENNSARFTGGGVSNDIGSLTVLGGTVSGNEASDSTYVDPGSQIKTGGGIYSEGTLEVSGTTFASNDARGTVGDPAIGGALVVRTPGVANVTTSAFNDNIGDYSSAIHIWYCSSSTPESVLTLDDATSFSGNLNRIAGPDVGSTGIVCPDAGPAGRGFASQRFLPDADLLERGSFR
ncbi:MAG: hypothetical protein KIT12_00340 [Trueperaceae bacterium]|nr:hypothetical protein [Trueperaceae bacterium]